MAGLMAEDVHGDDVVAVRVLLVRAEVGRKVLALGPLDQCLVLRHAIRPVPHVAELRADVDELLTGRLAVDLRRSTDQGARG